MVNAMGVYGFPIGFVIGGMAVNYIWAWWITQRDNRHGRN